MVKFELDLDKEYELTDEQVRMLEDLKTRPITFDEDCPELTKEDLDNLKYIQVKREQYKMSMMGECVS